MINLIDRTIERIKNLASFVNISSYKTFITPHSQQQNYFSDFVEAGQLAGFIVEQIHRGQFAVINKNSGVILMVW